jgi:3-dehydroquinate synthase
MKHSGLPASLEKQYHTIAQQFQEEHQSPIFIGTSCFGDWPRFFDHFGFGKSVVVVTNPQIRRHYASAIETAFQGSKYSLKIIDIPSGEQFKTMDVAQRLLDSFLDFKLERTDTVVAFGGGVVGDVAGFAASVYLRGINLVQAPTSLLAQVDAAIGGKTAVNHPRGKNLVGTFYQPRCVLIDLSTLATLPRKEMLCGLAEVVKYGAICNVALFDYIEKNLEAIKSMAYSQCPDIWQHLVTESAKAKTAVVTVDQKEAGLREILNFGHTFGHGIETAFNYRRFLHGEAVALGMAMASTAAQKMGLIDDLTKDRIVKLLQKLGFTMEIPEVGAPGILSVMASDKKVRDGRLRFVLPTALGKVEVRDDVPQEIIKQVIDAFAAKASYVAEEH